MTPPGTIRVPSDGVAWLAEACDRPAAGDGGLLAPTGVTFDSLETARVTGEHVIAWLLAEARPVGPVARDAYAGRVRFLIPPRGGLLVPDVVAEVIGAGGQVRLPGAATAGDARLRWLVAPRHRRPRLTDTQDLLAGLAACFAARDAADLTAWASAPAGDRPR